MFPYIFFTVWFMAHGLLVLDIVRFIEHQTSVIAMPAFIKAVLFTFIFCVLLIPNLNATMVLMAGLDALVNQRGN